MQTLHFHREDPAVMGVGRRGAGPKLFQMVPEYGLACFPMLGLRARSPSF